MVATVPQLVVLRLTIINTLRLQHRETGSNLVMRTRTLHMVMFLLPACYHAMCESVAHMGTRRPLCHNSLARSQSIRSTNMLVLQSNSYRSQSKIKLESRIIALFERQHADITIAILIDRNPKCNWLPALYHCSIG